MGHLSQQHLRIERFTYIIVGSAIRSFHTVLILCLGREQQNGNVSRFLPLAQLGTAGKTVHHRHHYIRQYQVGHLFYGHLHSLFPVLRFQYPIVFLHQVAQVTAHVGIVFYDKHRLTGGGTFFLRFL